MRIVIDMQGAQTESHFRGIGRYTMSLAKAIVRNCGKHEIILVLSSLFPDTIESIRAAFDDLLPQENIRVWHAPGPVRECQAGNGWRREVAELIREAFIASLKPDVVHIASLFEGFLDDAVTSIGVFAPQIPTVVTIHDLIPLLNPEMYLNPNPAHVLFYQRKIEYLKCANQWLAVSESAACEGRDALALPAESLFITYEGCDSVFRPLEITEVEKKTILERFDITHPFILCAGGADGHKNVHRLIRAYARLPKLLRDTHQLLLPGKIPDEGVAELRRTAKAAGIREGKLLFSGYVTDEELAQFYNLCEVFVFPSYHEGFGLPALEAMSCGAATIGSSVTSIPEVISLKDALFDPYDEVAISKKLAQVLVDETFRNNLAVHGLEQAKKFSWDKSARCAVAAFEKLYSVTAGNPKVEETENMIADLIYAVTAVVSPIIPDVDILNISHVLSRNHNENAPKQLLVDISELVQRDSGTGIQRVTRSILNELLENPPDGYVVDLVYATPHSRGYLYARHFTAHFYGVMSDLEDEPIDYSPGDIFLGIDLQHHVVISQKAYLAALRRDGVKVYFIVYDLLPILFPQYFPEVLQSLHKLWIETLGYFDGAICISRAVAEELLVWYRNRGPQSLRRFKIGWFHLGADIEASIPTHGLLMDAEARLSVFRSVPSFLMVGSIEPRKGYLQTLEAFTQLWQEGININLIIIGNEGWKDLPDDMRRNIPVIAGVLRNHPELNKRLFWLEGISDEYLGKVYAASTCLIAASEAEGFGLPLIEAAEHKLPIIARDIPVFREVAGEHAFYFNGIEPQALVDAVGQWLELESQGKAPRSDNMPRLTWKQSAEQLMKSVLGGDRQSTFVPRG